MLGVPITSTNLACYGELGRFPKEAELIAAIKCWMKSLNPEVIRLLKTLVN